MKDDRIASAMLCDQHWLRKQLASIEKARKAVQTPASKRGRSGRTLSEMELRERYESRLQASMERRDVRASRVPAIEYQQDLPIMSHRDGNCDGTARSSGDRCRRRNGFG